MRRVLPKRRHWETAVAWAAFASLGSLAWASRARAQAAPSPPSPLEIVNLPKPRTTGMPLERALASRRSIREFASEPLSAAQIGQLFWSAQGVTDASGGRTAPSAGALYPLEIYVATAGGILHYLPQGHRSAWLSTSDARPRLADAGFDQEALRQAPAIFVITAVVARTAAKYGDRAPLFAHLEAGHATQDLLLQATSLGLGAVPIGAFSPDEVRRALGLPEGEEPLYLVPVGRPRG